MPKVENIIVDQNRNSSLQTTLCTHLLNVTQSLLFTPCPLTNLYTHLFLTDIQPYKEYIIEIEDAP
jgi:hypothetical protein